MLHRCLTFIGFVLLLSGQVAHSQDPKPDDLTLAETAFQNDLRSARRSFLESIKKLTIEHNELVDLKKSEYLKALQTLMNQATQRSDLDGVIAIRNRILEYENTSFSWPLGETLEAVREAKIQALEKKLAEYQLAQADRSTQSAKGGLTGTWRWFDGSDYTARANGEMEGKLKGKWIQSDRDKSVFTIAWNNGATDTVKMALDGKLIEGKSSPVEMRVWAVRLK